MVFTPTNLFKGIPCPEGEKCHLTNCIFAHDLRPQTQQDNSTTISQTLGNGTEHDSGDIEPPAKRRRVAYEKLADKPPSRADLIRSQLAKERSKPTAPSSNGSVPASLRRSVSPPATATAKATSSGGPSKTSTPVKSTVLNPSLVSNDPAGHAKRSAFLKLLHAEMARLNQQLLERKDVQFKQSLILIESELMVLAMDEEEALAREKGAVYGNVIKNRIGTYKKMTVDDWITHLKTTTLFRGKQGPVAQHPGAKTMDPPKPIDTGLTPEEEIAILPHLVVKDQAPLAQFGYIPTPPTIEEATKAAEAVEAAKNYEICDRCTARFQVFPHRNSEGLLTSSGRCRHHPNRKVFPQRSKADLGPKEAYYPCCNEVVGSAGCTLAEHHVFVAKAPNRLAAVMPFITTPENESVKRSGKGKEVKAVAFDCEMGYTTLGLEMIRLTAVSWPEGEELVDVLVRPLGIILDLNSRFSGVWPEDITSALPYRDFSPPHPSQLDGADDIPPPPPMTIVDSPYRARELLCEYLTPGTPLIGHAIDNDLNVVRLCHPTIIDTIILYPHPRGLPLRFGLKMLTSKHLRRSIQQNSDGKGHDSAEDARATGDLVRLKVGEKWKLLRATGWKMVNGSLVPPPPLTERELEERRGSDGELANRLVDRAISGGSSKGRKRRRSSAAEVEGQQGNGLKEFLQGDGQNGQDGGEEIG